MKIKSVSINNFRLIYSATINMDKGTTLVVGKNNSGKTSFSELFRIFCSTTHTFQFEDFSLKCHKEFLEAFKQYSAMTDDNREETIRKVQSLIPKIRLLINIEYCNDDNWAALKPFIVRLDSSNTTSILFEYAPVSSEKFLIRVKELVDQKGKYDDTAIIEKFMACFDKHYKEQIRPYDDEITTENVTLSQVKKVMKCHFISAQRNVDDSNSNSSSKLSKVFQKQFDIKSDDEVAGNSSKKLQESVDLAGVSIDVELKKFFKDFVESFSIFGFPGLNNENLELKSVLSTEKLLENNVRLFFEHNSVLLPEKYNGLGYSNLIYIISQILGYQILNESTPSDLNLIFIEEPEAHMHPQMQSIFIKKINEFLVSKNFNVQIVITTHSSHVLADAELESIRYFCKRTQNIEIKDLMDFSEQLEFNEIIEFLKQYLTLGKCDLFFADKAILYEGTVERLLMPIFISKMNDTNLSEQYITDIEVGGAYMHKFKELLEFLELRTLIITDIDSVCPQVVKNKTSYKKCKVTAKVGLLTSNATIKQWLPGKKHINELIFLSEDDCTSGNIRVVYQKNIHKKQVKCGRSFEEAFIIDNCGYMFDNKAELLSIKTILSRYPSKNEIRNNSFIIQEYIDKNSKKTDLAFDLITVKCDKWNIPNYIKGGLLWLAK